MLPSLTHGADRQLSFSTSPCLQAASKDTIPLEFHAESQAMSPDVAPGELRIEGSELSPTNPSVLGSSGMLCIVFSKDLTGQSITEAQEALLQHVPITKERGCQTRHPYL